MSAIWSIPNRRAQAAILTIRRNGRAGEITAGPEGAHFDSPEESYLRKEAAEERRKALTEKQREAYVLYYEEGLTLEEIAEKLGVSLQAVDERLRYAKKKFATNPENFF